jgi:hypothetical protein
VPGARCPGTADNSPCTWWNWGARFIGAVPAHEDSGPAESEAPPLLACATLMRGKERRPLPDGPGADAYVRVPLRVTPEGPLP